MLLQHVWLAPLAKPETITEEDEEEVEAAHEAVAGVAAGDQGLPVPVDPVIDQEVADWVRGAIEKKRRGQMKNAEKPALHAAPLDVAQSPSHDTDGSGTAAPENAPA